MIAEPLLVVIVLFAGVAIVLVYKWLVVRPPR
jgi:hypothetical protein